MQPAITSSEVRLAISDVAKRVEAFEKRVSEFGRVFKLVDTSLRTRPK